MNGEMLMWSLYLCAVAGLVSLTDTSHPSIIRDKARELPLNEQMNDRILEMLELQNKRNWICARLRAVAREMGILHAEGLAVVAEMEREVWGEGVGADMGMGIGVDRRGSGTEFEEMESRGGEMGEKSEDWERFTVVSERMVL